MQIVEHEMFGKLRLGDVEGDVMFVAKDIANALRYSDTAKAVRTHCKRGRQIALPSSSGMQATTVIPESDVYRLVMRSKLPDAEQFQDWVCEEVLPSIRKTGAYSAGMISVPNFDDPVAAARAWADEREKKQLAESQVALMAPKAEFYDAVTATDEVCQLGVVCAMLEGAPGRNTLFRILRERGILIPSGDRRNHPYQSFVDRGYFVVKERHWEHEDKSGVAFTTYVTQKGIDWLRSRGPELWSSVQ